MLLLFLIGPMQTLRLNTITHNCHAGTRNSTVISARRNSRGRDDRIAFLGLGCSRRRCRKRKRKCFDFARSLITIIGDVHGFFLGIGNLDGQIISTIFVKGRCFFSALNRRLLRARNRDDGYGLFRHLFCLGRSMCLFRSHPCLLFLLFFGFVLLHFFFLF